MSGIVLTAVPDSFEKSIRYAYGERFNGDLRRVHDLASLRGPEELAHRLAQSNPDVVAIGPELPEDSALQVVAALDRTHPELSVVLVAAPTAELWQRALRAGARDIVAPNAPMEAVIASFDHAIETAQHRRNAIAAAELHPEPTNRVFVVVSPKGGSGKTVVSTNVAVTLAKSMPEQVVLVDLDLQFGDVASALRLEPQYTMVHAASTPSDSTALKAFLTRHSSELLVLCAPMQPEEADDISLESAMLVVKSLAQLFPYVVVDTGAGLDDVTLAAVEIATDIVFVSSTDVPSVRSMRKELQILDRLGLTSATRHFVLNRADARVGLVAGDIESTTGLAVSTAIPSSRAVPMAVNQGVPVVQSEPRSPTAKALVSFASSLEPARNPASRLDEPRPTSGGLFRRSTR